MERLGGTCGRLVTGCGVLWKVSFAAADTLHVAGLFASANDMAQLMRLMFKTNSTASGEQILDSATCMLMSLLLLLG